MATEMLQRKLPEPVTRAFHAETLHETFAARIGRETQSLTTSMYKNKFRYFCEDTYKTNKTQRLETRV